MHSFRARIMRSIIQSTIYCETIRKESFNYHLWHDDRLDMCVIIKKNIYRHHLSMRISKFLWKAYSRFALYWDRLIEKHFKFLPNVYRCIFSNRIFAYLFGPITIIFFDLKNDIEIRVEKTRVSFPWRWQKNAMNRFPSKINRRLMKYWAHLKLTQVPYTCPLDRTECFLPLQKPNPYRTSHRDVPIALPYPATYTDILFLYKKMSKQVICYLVVTSYLFTKNIHLCESYFSSLFCVIDRFIGILFGLDMLNYFNHLI